MQCMFGVITVRIFERVADLNQHFFAWKQHKKTIDTLLCVGSGATFTKVVTGRLSLPPVLCPAHSFN